MGGLPFTERQFFEVFAAYNSAVWPAPIILPLIALVVAALAWRRSDVAGPLVSWFLALLWMWTGVAYHILHFSEINPAATLFGVLFVLQGGLFLWSGVMRDRVRFVAPRGLRGAVVASILAYALVVYPLIGLASGQGLGTGPTFGAPCPAVIYTFGILLLVREPPVHLLVIPVLWALVGSSAVLAFGVWQDTGLAVAALLTIWVVARDRRKNGGSSAQRAPSTVNS